MTILEIIASVIKFCSTSPSFTQCAKAFKDIGLENTIPSLVSSGLLPREYLMTKEDYEEWSKLINVVSGDPRGIATYLVDKMLMKCIEEDCDIDCASFDVVVSKYFLPELPKDLRDIVIRNVDWDVVEKEFVEECKKRVEKILDSVVFFLGELGLFISNDDTR